MRLIIIFLCITLFTQCGQTQKSSTKDSIAIAKVKSTDVNGAKKMIDTIPELIIIDSRTPEEFVGGTLPKAINIDVKNSNFVDQINALDKNAQYLIHCRSGKRSAKAANIMVKNGFKDVTNMEGGYLAWPKE